MLTAACKMLREEGIRAAWMQGDVRSSKVGKIMFPDSCMYCFECSVQRC